MLRMSIQTKIISTLRNADLPIPAEDFSITFSPLLHQATELRIKYRYDESFYFCFKCGIDPGGMFHGTISTSPGQFLKEETEKVEFDLVALCNYIIHWISDVQEELISLPIKRHFEEHQAQIDQLFEAFESLPDTYFTRAEADDFKIKLDELEERISGIIQASSVSDQEKEERVKKLHKEIEELKSQLDLLKKSNFVKRTISRIWGGLDEESKKKIFSESGKYLGHLTKGFLTSGDQSNPQ